MYLKLTLALLLTAGCAPASYEIVRPEKKGTVVDGKPSPTPGNKHDDPDDNPATPPGETPPAPPPGPGDVPRHDPVPNPGNPGTPSKPGKPDPCDPGKPSDPGCPNTPGQNPGQNPGQTPGQTPGQHPPIPPVQRSEAPTGQQCNSITVCSQTQLPKCSSANDGITAYVKGFRLLFLCNEGKWREIPLPEGWPED